MNNNNYNKNLYNIYYNFKFYIILIEKFIWY